VGLKDRIKLIRQREDLTQAEFSIKLGLSRNAIASYEIGHRSPMENVILSICREFNVNYEWLKNGRGEMFADQDILDLIETVLARENEFTKRVFRSFAKLPDADWEALERLIDSISDQAAGGYSVINEFPQYADMKGFSLPVSAGRGIPLDGCEEEVIAVPVSVLVAKADYVIRVAGDSMTPFYEDGDILLVKEQGYIDHGEVGIFCLNGEGFVKQLYKLNGDTRLISMNKKYPDVVIHDYDRIDCRGKVIGRA